MAHFGKRSPPELIRYGFTSLYRVCFVGYSKLFFSALCQFFNFILNSVMSLQGCQQILLAGDLLAEEDNKIEIEVAKVRSELEAKLQETEKNLSAAVSQMDKLKSEGSTYKSNAESAIRKLELMRKDYVDLEVELKKAQGANDELAREKRDLASKVRALEAEVEKEKVSVAQAVADDEDRVKGILVGQLTDELEATYQLAWDTLVELASAQFPGIAAIPFERRELPAVDDPVGGDAEEANAEAEGQEETGVNEPEVSSLPEANAEAGETADAPAEAPAIAVQNGAEVIPAPLQAPVAPPCSATPAQESGVADPAAGSSGKD